MAEISLGTLQAAKNSLEYVVSENIKLITLLRTQKDLPPNLRYLDITDVEATRKVKELTTMLHEDNRALEEIKNLLSNG